MSCARCSQTVGSGRRRSSSERGASKRVAFRQNQKSSEYRFLLSESEFGYGRATRTFVWSLHPAVGSAPRPTAPDPRPASGSALRGGRRSRHLVRQAKLPRHMAMTHGHRTQCPAALSVPLPRRRPSAPRADEEQEQVAEEVDDVKVELNGGDHVVVDSKMLHDLVGVVCQHARGGRVGAGGWRERRVFLARCAHI